MKTGSEKTADVNSTTATRAKEGAFFGKGGGEGFFERTNRIKAPVVQAKLTINELGDQYEQEADQVADQVMRMKSNDASFFPPSLGTNQSIQRKCDTCEQEEDEKVQRKETNDGVSGQAAPPIVSEVISSGGGQSLNTDTKGYMESRMGQDFSQVRVHTDTRAAESAAAIQAKAYTSGQDVVFGAGQYQPGSEDGKRLLAHELVHTVQQSTGKVQTKIQRKAGPEEEAAKLLVYPYMQEKNPKRIDTEWAIPFAEILSYQAKKQKEDVVLAVFNKLVPPDDYIIATEVIYILAEGHSRFSRFVNFNKIYTPPTLSAALVKKLQEIIKSKTSEKYLEEKKSPLFKGESDLDRLELLEGMQDWPLLFNKKSAILSNATIRIIKKNRDAIKDHADLMKQVKKGGRSGIVYGGKLPEKEVVNDEGEKEKRNKPDEFYPATGEKTDTDKIEILEVLRKELVKGEGKPSSVQTYDAERFTWGLGFAATGILGVAIRKFAEKDEKYKQMLKDVGIYYQGDIFLVVDTDDRSIKSGGEAGKVIEKEENSVQKPLLSFFIEIAENQDTAFDAYNAQWEAIRATAGNIPDYALKWPKVSIAVLAHLSHWLSSISWAKSASKSSTYKNTGGDLLKIILQFSANMDSAIVSKRANFIQTRKNGAKVFINLMEHLGQFGHGADQSGIGKTTLQNAANHYKAATIDAYAEKITDVEKYFFIESGTEYYVIPSSPDTSVPDSNTAFDAIFKKMTEEKKDDEKEEKISKKSLEISHPQDASEKEADEVARRVVDGQSAEINGANENINGSVEVSREFQSLLKASKGVGRPLGAPIAREMESKMGADFSAVRIHTGSDANQMSEDIQAKAFTHGQDVYFRDGNHDTNSREGKELLAHELVHTVQQGGGNIKRQTTTGTPDKDQTAKTAQGAKDAKTATADPEPVTAPDITTATTTIITGIKDNLIAIAKHSTTEEIVNEQERTNTPKTKKKPAIRVPLPLIMKYVWQNTILPQLESPTKTQRKPGEKYATPLTPVGALLAGLYTDEMVEAIKKVHQDIKNYAVDQTKDLKEGKEKEQKKITKNLAKQFYDSVLTEVLRTLEKDYTSTRLNTTTDSILAEYAALNSTAKGLLEGGLEAYYATRKGLMAKFGDAAYPLETITAFNNYVNILVHPTFMMKANQTSGTLIHPDLNAALNRAETFMRTKGWYEEVAASDVTYWSTNVRENRNNPAYLSEHSFGFALDIKDNINPNLANVPKVDWAFVDEMLGEQAIHSKNETPLEKEIDAASADKPETQLASVEKLKALSDRYKSYFNDQTLFVKRIAEILQKKGLSKPLSDLQKALTDYLSPATETSKKTRATTLETFLNKAWKDQVDQTPLTTQDISKIPVAGKIEKLLQAKIKNQSSLAASRDFITEQVTKPQTQVPGGAKKVGLTDVYSAAVSKELNLLTEKDRKVLAEMLIVRLEVYVNLVDADNKAKETNTWTVKSLSRYENANSLIESEDKKKAKKGDKYKLYIPGQLSGISAFGFMNLSPKLVTALMNHEGGDLAWLGVRNSDMHHFELKKDPEIPKSTPPPLPTETETKEMAK